MKELDKDFAKLLSPLEKQFAEALISIVNACDNDESTRVRHIKDLAQTALKEINH